MPLGIRQSVKGLESNKVYMRIGGMERMEWNGVHVYEQAIVVTPKKVRKRWGDKLHYAL